MSLQGFKIDIIVMKLTKNLEHFEEDYTLHYKKNFKITLHLLHLWQLPPTSPTYDNFIPYSLPINAVQLCPTDAEPFVCYFRCLSRYNNHLYKPSFHF